MWEEVLVHKDGNVKDLLEACQHKGNRVYQVMNGQILNEFGVEDLVQSITEVGTMLVIEVSIYAVLFYFIGRGSGEYDSGY
jgi:hypothetical protein